VREARLLVHARSAIIGTLGPHAGMLTVRGHDGARAHLIRPGAELPLEGSLAVPVIRTARTLVLSEPAPAPYADVVARFGLGPVMCVPLLAGGRVFGVMAVAQSPGGPAFGRARIALIEAFAGQAAVALEFQRVRHELRSLAVVEERERIARDLHDGAIQALFGLGMEVDSLAREASQAAECGALTRAVDCLEEAIRSLRSVIGRLVPAPS
jgi:signal transduction histidine kinase